MRTTLDLPDSLFREVKSRAALEGLKMKELVAQFIEAGLRAPVGLIPSEYGHADPLPVAIPRDSGKSPGKVMTNEELNVLLEEEDLENNRRVMASSTHRGE